MEELETYNEYYRGEKIITRGKLTMITETGAYIRDGLGLAWVKQPCPHCDQT